ncbi:MAG TPA: tetratricopeptide repeat protein [Nitrospirales bacterium]|nr:tetratricopeptide repeat protein [Nitrospirales bacterium]
MLRTLPLLFIIGLLLTPAAFAEEETGDDILLLTKQMVGLQQAGRHRDALPLARRTVELAEEELGGEHPTLAIYLDYLGMLHHAVGEGIIAEPLLQRALTIREHAAGLESIAVSHSLEHLAAVYRALGQDARAGELTRRSAAIREKLQAGTK